MAHIQKILVPVDASPCSIAALTHAIALAEDLGALIDVLHVVGPDAFEVGSATPSADAAAQQANREMEAAIGRAQAQLGDRAMRRTASGDPLRTILETAGSGQYDLIVMGTHGRVGRLHSLIGSVAEGVVRNAPCPVLTIRQPDGEEESFAERIHGTPSLAQQVRS